MEIRIKQMEETVKMEQIFKLAVLKKLYDYIEEPSTKKALNKKECEFVKEFLDENYSIIYNEICIQNREDAYVKDNKGRKIYVPASIADDCVIVQEKVKIPWHLDDTFISEKRK